MPRFSLFALVSVLGKCLNENVRKMYIVTFFSLVSFVALLYTICNVYYVQEIDISFGKEIFVSPPKKPAKRKLTFSIREAVLKRFVITHYQHAIRLFLNKGSFLLLLQIR